MASGEEPMDTTAVDACIGQQVTVINEHGETIYIQLPPDVTIDDNSIITSETTEEGDKIFRVIGVSDQNVASLQQDGDDALQGQEVGTEVDGEMVTVLYMGTENEVAMDTESNQVVVMEGEGQEVPKPVDQVQGVIVNEPHDKQISTLDNPNQEVIVSAAAGQQTVTENTEPGIHEVQDDGKWDIIGQALKAENLPSGEAFPNGEDVANDGTDLLCNNNGQDLAVFQQALEILQQQTEGEAVVQEDAEGNIIYILQPKKDDVAIKPLNTVADGDFTAPEEDAEQSDTINIVNPETGKVEQVPKASLESAPELSIKPELTAATDVIGLTNLLPPDPIVIAPIKRGRGRPRKDKNAPRPQRRPSPQQVVVEEEEDVGPPGIGGRPRRKAALKFFKKLEAIKQDLGDDKIEFDVPRSPSSAQPELQAVKPMRVQDKKFPVQDDVDPTDAHPAIVNIKIKDKTTLQVMNDIGIHMLYYCRRCTFFSTQMMVVTRHILACRQREVTSENQTQAADAAYSSALLVNAALHDIAKRGADNSKSDGLVEKNSKLDALDDDLNQVDEHNYAAEDDDDNALKGKEVPGGIVQGEGNVESKIVYNLKRQDEKLNSEGVQDEQVAEFKNQDALDKDLQNMDARCHLCSEDVDVTLMTAHLREAHAVCEGDAVTEILDQVQVQVQAPCTAMQIKVEDFVDDAANVVEEAATDTMVEEANNAVNTEAGEISLNAEESNNIGTSELDFVSTNSRFRCPSHEVTFPTQSSMTQHYVELHWGGTKEQVAAAEEQKRKAKELKQNKLLVKKRGRGRPRKYPLRVNTYDSDGNEVVLKADGYEDSMGKDDDDKDPDFDIKTAAWESTSKIRFQDLPNIRQKGGSSKCLHCYKRFATATNLKLHIKHQHTGDKTLPVSCHFCEKYFKNKVQLRNHVRCVHEGRKRRYVYKHYPVKKKVFMCEECGYTTPELCRLKNHKLSVHEGQYPYVCEICDYKTNEKADMRRHEHKHQGIKRYDCQFCSYRSDQRWLLVNHCQRQHAIRLDRQTRNTRGSFWSNRRTRKEETNNKVHGGGGEGSGQLPAAENPPFSSADAPMAYTQEIIIDQGNRDFQTGTGESYLVPMVTTNEHGVEEMAMYAVQHGVGDDQAMYAAVNHDGVEQEGAMYVVQQEVGDEEGAMYLVGHDISEHEVAVETTEEGPPGDDVVYIQGDGTMLEQEQAALMLLAVGPTPSGSNTDGAVQVETNYM